jgi:hypothetical protein
MVNAIDYLSLVGNIGIRNVTYILLAFIFVYLSEQVIGPVKTTDDIDTRSTAALLTEITLILWAYSLIFVIIQWIISILPVFHLPLELDNFENLVDTTGNWVFIYILLTRPRHCTLQSFITN